MVNIGCFTFSILSHAFSLYVSGTVDQLSKLIGNNTLLDATCPQTPASKPDASPIG